MERKAIIVRRAVDAVLSRLLIFIMAILVIDVLWQVASRYLLNSPSSYTDEIARYLMIWVALLGAAFITGRRGHLAIDLLSPKLTARKQRLLALIIDTLIMIFGFFVMLIGGLRLVYVTLKLEQISPALQMPLGYVYVVIPLSGVLILLYSILNILDDVHANIAQAPQKEQ